MPYRLGVDLGSASTLAAVRVDDGPPRLLGLGTGPQMPSVVHLAEDGRCCVGEEAERRGDAEPDRLARGFARLLGSDVPVRVAGREVAAQTLVVALLQHVLAVATGQQGGPPEELVRGHPAGEDADGVQQVDAALTAALGVPVRSCPDPVAVATADAGRSTLEPGGRVLVYDLGATLDLAVLERTAGGFVLRGTPEASDAVGGTAFDEAVYRLVLAGLGDEVRALDAADPALLVPLARVRRDAVRAKEALTGQPSAEVPVDLPGLTTTVTLRRADLGSLVRPALRDSVDLVTRVLRSASVAGPDLAAVRLVGGSASIPAVATLLARELGVPVAADPHPTYALGTGLLLVGRPPAPEGTPMPVAAPARPAGSASSPPEAEPRPTAGPPPPLPVPVGTARPTAAAVWAPVSRATPVRVARPPESAPSAPDSWLSQVLTEASAGGPSWSPTPPGGPGPQGQPSPGYRGGPPAAYAGGPPPGPGGQPPSRPGGPRRPSGPPPSGAGGGEGGNRRLFLVIGAVVVALALLAGIGVLVARAVRRPDAVAQPPVVQPASVPASLPAALPSATPSVSAVASASSGAPPASASGSAPPPPPPATSQLPGSAALPLTTAVVPLRIDGQRDLYLVDTTKRTKPVRLPTPDGADTSPTMLPSRGTVIYLNDHALRVMAADGTGDRSLVDDLPKGCDSVDRVNWNPVDPTQLLLECISDKEKYSLQVVGLDGTLVRRLPIAKDRIEEPVLSADGLTVAYWASNDLKLEGGSIYTIPLDGSAQPTRLTKEDAGTDADPAWSPDGSQLAFTRRIPDGSEDGNFDVWVMNFDGSEPLSVAETPAADIKPSWSADGKQLLVISDRDSAVGEAGKAWDLWLTRVKDGRVLRSMGVDAQSITTPFWVSR